jgi:hypothetical protein
MNQKIEIETIQSLNELKDYWLNLANSPEFDVLPLTEKLEITKLKDKKKAELNSKAIQVDLDRKQKQIDWEKTPTGKVIMQNKELFLEYVEVTKEMDLRQEIKDIREKNNYIAEHKEEITLARLSFLMKNIPEMVDKVTVEPDMLKEPTSKSTLSWSQLKERHLYIKKYFRFKGVELE